MNKWVVYCAGNSDYILSPNEEPIKMLKSFQEHFGDRLDYVYFTDINEPNLDEVEAICNSNGITLVMGSCKQYYQNYKDLRFINNPRWPDAHYWYCEAPDYLINTYDYAIKCDGDMMCLQDFDLSLLEVDNEITITQSPDWYTPFDKFCPNAGFQILNLKKYVENNIKQLFREGASNPDLFNGDTPVLDNLIGIGKLNVKYLSADYNYLLFDLEQVRNLKLANLNNVKIVHFVETKPHNLNSSMSGSVKEYFSKIYRGY